MRDYCRLLFDAAATPINLDFVELQRPSWEPALRIVFPTTAETVQRFPPFPDFSSCSCTYVHVSWLRRGKTRVGTLLNTAEQDGIPVAFDRADVFYLAGRYRNSFVKQQQVTTVMVVCWVNFGKMPTD